MCQPPPKKTEHPPQHSPHSSHQQPQPHQTLHEPRTVVSGGQSKKEITHRSFWHNLRQTQCRLPVCDGDCGRGVCRVVFRGSPAVFTGLSDLRPRNGAEPAPCSLGRPYLRLCGSEAGTERTQSTRKPPFFCFLLRMPPQPPAPHSRWLERTLRPPYGPAGWLLPAPEYLSGEPILVPIGFRPLAGRCTHWAPPRDALERGTAPRPPSRAPGLCPAAVSLTTSAGFHGICDRQ